jgi:glycosyltransferase involved in cell wall biosynthesis
MKSKHILFLYSRFADYFYQCINYFLEQNKDFRITVICYPKDKDVPFFFEENERLRILSSEKYSNEQSLIKLAEEQNTVGIYVTGWFNTKYLNVAKHFFGKIPTIVGIDNAWESTLRQQIGVLVYQYKLRQTYSHIWCPGGPQIEFARRLGYKHHQILKGLYVANTPVFERTYHERLEEKSKNYPKKLLFVGRYVEYKKPLMLVKVFSELVNEKKHNGWTLELIGSGNLKDELIKYQNKYITINDFIPPNQLPKKLGEAGAFCLPSESEHWGVVVHEAVTAGLPLIVSDTVYSCTEFLLNGYNGWGFETNNELALKKALEKLFSKSSEELVLMGHNSFSLSERISQSYWEANLKSTLDV